MGFLINKNLPSGIIVNGSYARISNVFGTKNNLMFSIDYFMSREADKEGKSSFYQESFQFTPDVKDDAVNIFKQAYRYVKTVDGFQSAIDVLEEGQSA
ncbi:hypothetical protein [Bacillus cereus group sp. BfR-BA-01448]|uniref:hypothetical protein n=1 Tax=Bacillus cereus group sp. BfR-BA-01448 TaxID=2920352 RepID=UPI001F5767BF|nr:hypothetical protein [Bacillus cereus group sp. BfR-BA-01448]